MLGGSAIQIQILKYHHHSFRGGGVHKSKLLFMYVVVNYC